MEAFKGQNYHFRGLLGGGDMDDLSTPYKVALLDVNLDTDYFYFGLTPAPLGSSYIGFNGQLDLNSNSYFSMAEFSSPQSDFHLNDLQGRISWVDGEIDLRSPSDNTPAPDPLTTAGQASLSISNGLLLGKSATGFNFTGAPAVRSWGAGQPLTAGVGFGSENFGHVAFPGGVWHNTIVLQSP
jgi:hypothetical protein